MQKIYSITVSNVQKGILLDLVEHQYKHWNSLDDVSKKMYVGSKLKTKIYEHQLNSLRNKLLEPQTVGATIL